MRAIPTMISATNRTKALTFIEILIVIIIIGILTGISAPRFRKTFDNLELENFVKDIYYLARYLQGCAIAEGKIYYLGIDDENRALQAKYKDEDEFKTIKGRFGRVYKTPQRVILSTQPPEKKEIYFYPDGSIDRIKINFENQQRSKFSLTVKGVAGEIQIE